MKMSNRSIFTQIVFIADKVLIYNDIHIQLKYLFKQDVCSQI